MFRSGNRGTVLVASLIILALLSLLGAGSLMNASLDTQLATNQSMANEAFYAAEAALDTGVGEVYETVVANLSPYDPVAEGTDSWTTPTSPAAMDFTDVNGYTVEYQITYAGATWPTGDPMPYQFSQLQSGQALESDAYTYLVEGRATSNTGDGTVEQMSETLQVLETPLVQYFVFFNDDLGWHHGPVMTSWGRIHTNGDIGFANQDPFTFQNYDGNNNETPSVITASGIIRYQGHLQQNGTWSSRATDPVNIRVRNLGTIPSAASTDFEEIDTTIDATTQAVQEARFVDSDGVSHVRVGVDRMPSVSFNDIARGGFYETEAADPFKPNVDGMVITADAGLRIWFQPFDGPGEWVTDRVRDYEVAPGVSVDFDGSSGAVGAVGWSLGARINANGTNAPATIPALGSIVYAPGDVVATDDGGAGAYTDHRTPADANPWFPCVLEEEDDRENQEVDLLVIDFQRLQEWYRDYLDHRDGGGLDNSIDATLGNRSLLIYASLSNAATATGGAMPAVKLIGSRSGRVRNANLSQQSPTMLVRTTLVTDNPVYMDGDFNAPGMTADTSPGSAGCAIVGDALTVLSTEWGNDHFDATTPNTGGGGAGAFGTSTLTAFNAAFFVGRYDFRGFPTGGEEAGIHNFPHLLEGWTVSPYITGCLINLWFSQQSDGPHSGAYYSAPPREFGWDRQFANRAYWPPYVPSIYSVERVAWRED